MARHRVILELEPRTGDVSSREVFDLERQEALPPPRRDAGKTVASHRTRNALIAVDTLTGMTAVAGGIALVTGMEDDRFPATWLQGTPFRTYRVPGLLLATLVGGSATAAAVTTINHQRAGGQASSVAGVVLMGWIVGEIRLLKQPTYGTWTERFFFAIGLLMTVLGSIVGRAMP